MAPPEPPGPGREIALLRGGGADPVKLAFKEPAGVLRIGRHPGSDFVLDVEGVSVHHAELVLEVVEPGGGTGDGGARLSIRDLSKNGIAVRPGPGTREFKEAKREPRWESLERGTLRALGNGWQLLIPFRSRNSDTTVAQEERIMTVECDGVEEPPEKKRGRVSKVVDGVGAPLAKKNKTKKEPGTDDGVFDKESATLAKKSKAKKEGNAEESVFDEDAASLGKKSKAKRVAAEGGLFDPEASPPPGSLEEDKHAANLVTHDMLQEEVTKDPEPPAAVPVVEVVRVARLQALIRGVLERKNPAKLPELDKLLAKYAGSEEEVYLHVCQKYGEVPVGAADRGAPPKPQQEPERESVSAPRAPDLGRSESRGRKRKKLKSKKSKGDLPLQVQDEPSAELEHLDHRRNQRGAADDSPPTKKVKKVKKLRGRSRSPRRSGSEQPPRGERGSSMNQARPKRKPKPRREDDSPVWRPSPARSGSRSPLRDDGKKAKLRRRDAASPLSGGSRARRRQTPSRSGSMRSTSRKKFKEKRRRSPSRKRRRRES